MWTDPIVDELRRIREAHAARFDNDLRVIVRDLRALEAAWPGPEIDPAAKLAVTWQNSLWERPPAAPR